MHLSKLTKDDLLIAQEIMNSNRTYNVMENDCPTRTLAEIREEFLNPDTESYLLYKDSQAIGLIDFLAKNPKDDRPWLGLLIIDEKLQGQGYGTLAYELFEKQLMMRNVDTLRLGVIKDNTKARKFWESQGFLNFDERLWNDRVVVCYEKDLNLREWL